jgi:predicted site-specific integrase-resolvase
LALTDDLVGDVVEVLTPFCARPDGRRYGSIEFTGEYAEGILLVAEEYF